jgi:hypothetical protein
MCTTSSTLPLQEAGAPMMRTVRFVLRSQLPAYQSQPVSDPD